MTHLISEHALLNGRVCTWLEKKERSEGRAKAILINISVSIITFFILFAVAEVACRLFYDKGIPYHPVDWAMNIGVGFYDNEGGLYINTDNGLLYRMNYTLYDERYTRFFPSDIGVKCKGRYRIVVLGDSFTAGAGLLNLSDIYTRYLYDMLNSWDGIRDAGIDEFEILSFSGAGLNTYQELELLNLSAIRYNPDMIILQYTDNDINGMRSPIINVESGYYVDSRTHFLILDDGIIPALPYLDEKASWILLQNSVFLRVVSYKINIIMMKNDPYSSFKSIREINEMAKKNNIPFIIINFVSSLDDKDYCNETYPDGGGKQLHNELRILADELNIPFYNMCDYADPLQIKTFMPPPDFHYNKEGHRIAAEVLKDAVIEKISGNSEDVA